MNRRISIERLSIILLLVLISGLSRISAQPGQGQRGGGDGELPKIGKLTGKVIDSEEGEPLMYASIVLNNVRDSTMVSGAITREDGTFTMEQLPPGTYFITINYVGFPPQDFNNIRITFREPEFDMGVIEISPSAQVLNEVTVEAARSLMETGLDRRVINVGQEITAIGGTGLDIMQNIPSVAVDFDGNVSLRGSSNVTILIDGRPSTLTGLSGSEALEQIPAEMIERVEVITNPSARYNPEGTSGIINVVLKEQRRPGYNGMVSLNAGSEARYSGSINLNYKVNKWNFFTNYSGRLSDMDFFGNSSRETFNAGSSNFMDQDITGDMGMNSHNIQAGIDYNFNQKNTLTFSSRYSNWNRSFDNLTEYMLYSDLTNPNSLFLMDNETDMLHNSFTHQLNFRRTYDEKHRELIADVSFSTRNMDRNENFFQEFYEQNWSNPNGQILEERSNMFGDNWSLTTQLDYIHPLSEESKFETGYRIQLREMDSDFNFENFNSEVGNWISNPNRSNHFIYNEQIFAAYGMYATMLGKFSIQAGLRAEQTFTTADQRSDVNPTYDNQYLSLFPTAHIRRNFENNQSMQISYSRRINRPHNRNINPFLRYNSEYDVSFGNPDLDPEFINSYEIGYQKFWKTTTLNPSLFYRYTNGMITRYRYVDQIEGNDVTVSTYDNLNRGISYGTELILTQRISDWWNVNTTLSYFRSIIDGAQMAEEADSYSWSGRFVSNMNLGSGWNIQANGFYRSPIIMLQGEMDAMYSASAGVRKNIWGNSGTISLNVSDIFNTMRFSMYNYGDNFTMDMERWRTSRMITLGFTYRINEFERRNNRRMRENGTDDSMDFDDFEI
ncbi:MAG: TonB-dependent receptor domain-containing protein [Bacteroidales bacterium]